MTNHIILKLITTPESHLWEDALHARELARSTNDEWMKGTYVRWTVIFAWIALEQYCKDALDDEDMGTGFRNKVDEALKKIDAPVIKWYHDSIWSDVDKLRKSRINFIHKNLKQKDLWPDIQQAENAIAIVRLAVKDIYKRVGKDIPIYVDVDNSDGYR